MNIDPKLMHYAFVDARESLYMPMKTKREAEHYLNAGLEKGTIVRRQNALFDIPSLNEQFFLDCVHCEGCCQGTTIPPTKDDCDFIFGWHEEILKEMCSDEDFQARMEHIRKYGLFAYDFDYHHWYDTIEDYQHPTFRMFRGKCVFSVPFRKENPDAAFVCAIHGYALKNGFDVFDFKPKACQLFPVDIIKISDIDFVFGISVKTRPFNRWCYFYEECCVPKHRAESIYRETGTFNPDKYEPAYRCEQHLLERLYGKDIIGFLTEESKRRGYS